MSLKYVMFNDGFPIIFGDYWQHKDVAERLGYKFGEVTSAGFVGHNADGSVFATGESISLDKKPAELDTEVLKMVLGNPNTSPPLEGDYAFGLFDHSMASKLKRLLKPYGLVLDIEKREEWGDQVRVSVKGKTCT